MTMKKQYEKPTIKEVVIMQHPLLQSASLDEWQNGNNGNMGGDEG